MPINTLFGRRAFLGSAPFFAQGGSARQTAPSGSLVNRLVAYLDKLEIIDAMEHVIPEEERLAGSGTLMSQSSRGPTDFFSLAGTHFLTQCRAAGMPPQVAQDIRSPKRTLSERWGMFEPYWRLVRSNGVGQVLRLAIRDLYGVDEISLSALPRINAAIAREEKPGLYRRLLKDRSRIRLTVNHDFFREVPVRQDPELFLLVCNFDKFLSPGGGAPHSPAASGRAVEPLEKLFQVSITSLRDLKSAAQKWFQQGLEVGMVGIKTSIGHSRDLLFREVPEADAARAFERLLKEGRPPASEPSMYFTRPYRALEDHMFHYIMQLADAHDIRVLIHSGFSEGRSVPSPHANPTHLFNVFSLYPRIGFHMVHLSYPYSAELSMLALRFPNIHVSFDVVNDYSPAFTQEALDQYLDLIPLNKIFAFGGDYRYPELTYALAKMARRTIARVLADRVERGVFKEEEAAEVGKVVLHDSLSTFYESRLKQGRRKQGI